MENKLFSKFSFYDQIAYVLVGSIVLLVIAFDFWLLGFNIPKLNGAELIILFIIAYFLGHLIQSIANLIIKEKKDDFSKQDQEILNIARESFGFKEKTDNEIYRFCYMISLSKDISGQVQSFNAYYSLYRGWFTLFIFQSLFLVYYFISIFFSLKALFLLITSIGVAVLFYFRLKRFYKYSREKTLQTFLIIKKLNKEKN